MKRNIAALLLAIAMCTALAACGSDAGNASPSPSDSVQPSESPSVEPSVSPSGAPSQEPVDENSGAPEGSVDLQAFYEGFTANEEFSANMAIEGEFLEQKYPGLSDIATKQRVIYEPMMSGAVCEIALVEVENAADVDAVKEIFQARIDAQVGTEDEPGGAFYPASIEAWQNSSSIVSNGNYVMLIAWDSSEDVVSAFQNLF